MERFHILYNEIIQNMKQNKPILGQNFIQLGMDLANKTTEIQQKTYIFEKMIEVFPEEPAFYYYMGYAIKDADPMRALPYFERSYSIEPNNLENCIDMGNILYQSGQGMKLIELGKTGKFDGFLKDARFLTIYTQAKCEQFHYKDCLTYLLYLIKSRSTEPALTEHDREWKFSNYLNTGHIYSIYSNHEKAVQYTEKAFEMSMKFNLNQKRKLSGIQNLLSFMDYGYMDTEVAYQKALRINEVILDKPSFSHDRPANSKVRIGYVSSDFANHAVSNFILPILKHHDHNRFEVYAYLAQPSQSYRTESIRAITRNIFDLDDLAAAKQIYSDHIDILVDLNGHTANSRIAVFAFRPAPIQISYIGYPNTTGLHAIQYRITDSVADHPETRQKYSETLIRLPKCFLLYESIGQMTPITPRKTGPIIILGALNKEKKNTTYVLETWKRVLEECPNTKLLIKLDGYDDVVARTQFYMKHLGVEKNRLLIFPKTSDPDYLRLFTMIDILLDTFPYSGTTTTCNTLYNSIPVVSYYHNDYHAHNVSSSILINMCSPEFVAKSRDEYVDIIKTLVSKPNKIDEYKQTLGKKFARLMSPQAFMKTYEARLEILGQKKDSVIEIRL